MIKTEEGYTKLDGNIEDLLWDFLSISTALKDVISEELPRDIAKEFLHALIDEEIDEEDKTIIDMTGLNKMLNDLSSED